ncbi:MAG: isopentenyl-diphosphate Delta-isomerase [Sporichthyaceae bacterium]
MNSGEARVEELVVLLDEYGQPCGTAPKATVHHGYTPLHLAFSCWLFDPTGNQVLLTRRAPTKRTWPLAWTNSFCGHPGPAESVENAVRRRAADELGVDVGELRLELPDFRYTARMASGVTENEVCPVFTATLDGDPQPDPAEVDSFAWVPWSTLAAAVAADPERYSPWMRLQLPLLAEKRGG